MGLAGRNTREGRGQEGARGAGGEVEALKGWGWGRCWVEGIALGVSHACRTRGPLRVRGLAALRGEDRRGQRGRRPHGQEPYHCSWRWGPCPWMVPRKQTFEAMRFGRGDSLPTPAAQLGLRLGGRVGQSSGDAASLSPGARRQGFLMAEHPTERSIPHATPVPLGKSVPVAQSYVVAQMRLALTPAERGAQRGRM